MRKVELLSVFTGAVLGEQSTPLVGCLRADDQKPIRRSDEEFAWAQDNTAIQDLEQSVGRKNGQVTHLIVDVVNSSWLVLFVVVRLTVFVALGGVRIQKGWLFADLPGVGAG